MQNHTHRPKFKKGTPLSIELPLHRHRKSVGSFSDEFSSSVPGFNFDMCSIQHRVRYHKITIWHDMVWYIIWHAIVWHNMAWYSWFATNLLGCARQCQPPTPGAMVGHTMVCMAQYGTVWHGMAWHGMAWHGMAPCTVK